MMVIFKCIFMSVVNFMRWYLGEPLPLRKCFPQKKEERGINLSSDCTMCSIKADLCYGYVLTDTPGRGPSPPSTNGTAACGCPSLPSVLPPSCVSVCHGIGDKRNSQQGSIIYVSSFMYFIYLVILTSPSLTWIICWW